MKIEGKYLMINTDLNNEYDISLSQLSDSEKLEKWLCHMTEKNWWDKLKTQQMIQLIENHFKFTFTGKTHY